MEVLTTEKSALLKTTVFLRCEKKNHDDCLDLLKEVRQIGNVTYAETTNAIIGNEEYCVLADAVVKLDEIEKFSQKIDGLIQSGKAETKALFVSN